MKICKREFIVINLDTTVSSDINDIIIKFRIYGTTAYTKIETLCKLTEKSRQAMT